MPEGKKDISQGLRIWKNVSVVADTSRGLHVHNVGRQMIHYRTKENPVHPEPFPILMWALERSGFCGLLHLLFLSPDLEMKQLALKSLNLYKLGSLVSRSAYIFEN